MPRLRIGGFMTLIVSEISKYGIAMAADSAITTTFPENWTLPSGARVPATVRTGAQKLVPIRAINAAISVWGVGTVGTPDDPCARIPVDKFLLDFAERVRRGDSLEDVGERLAREMNDGMGDSRDAGGVHLAGYAEHQGRRFPALYHIHRGHPDESPGPLQLHRDWPFESGKTFEEALDYIEGGGFVGLRNGDFGVYALFAKYLHELMERLRKDMDFICPDHDSERFESPLQARGRYLKLQVETICEFYRLSNCLETIAMPVSWLTIPREPGEEIKFHPVEI